MPDIFSDFPIKASPADVFRAVSTQMRFHHMGWPESNEHYRVSCYCWPMYLRILRRYLEHGERVPYERRLDV